MGQLLTGNDNDVITTLLISTNNLFVYIISIVYFQVCLTESDAKHTSYEVYCRVLGYSCNNVSCANPGGIRKLGKEL